MMKEKNSGPGRQTSFQTRLEILCARYHSVTILSTPNGYRVHCEDEADMDTANSAIHTELQKAVRELTPDA